MPQAVCTDDKFIALWNRLKSPGKVATELGVSVRGVNSRRRRIESTHNITLAVADSRSRTPTADIGSPEHSALLDELRELRTKLQAAERNKLDAEYVKRKIMGLLAAPLDPPKWLTKPSSASHEGTSVPTLMLSDLHWGERVFAAQVNGVNEYDIAIAQRRLRMAMERAVHVLKVHLPTQRYAGVVLALGGDMLSGDIHEELSETNEVPVMVALIDLFGCLITVITRLADEFEFVFVPCVTGNHGRNTKKPRAKHRNYTNFDWLLYNMLARHFQGDKRVRFYIPDGSDAHWRVFGHRYCMTHGDQFRGGDGMIGALGPIIRGDHKKRSRNAQIDMEYDTLLMGHWHQLIQLQRLIVNGSLKGYDEYAASGNFGYEPPQQALWLTHSQRGITFSCPVQVDENAHQPRDREWITFAG